jgi:DNA-binding beta-propeller fold protein YncE
VTVGQRPRDIAFAPDSSAAYVSGEFDASLYRIGLQGVEPARLVLQLRKEARPMAIVMDAARKRLYMSTGRGGTVAVINGSPAPRLVAEVPVGTRPWGIALGRWQPALCERPRMM